jgi:hypothetical protein
MDYQVLAHAAGTGFNHANTTNANYNFTNPNPNGHQRRELRDSRAT